MVNCTIYVINCNKILKFDSILSILPKNMKKYQNGVLPLVAGPGISLSGFGSLQDWKFESLNCSNNGWQFNGRVFLNEKFRHFLTTSAHFAKLAFFVLIKIS